MTALLKLDSPSLPAHFHKESLNIEC